MHVLPVTSEFAKLSKAEKLFLESWFNLTHDRSLDSFRVRCHNGRTILEELQRELSLGVANADDISPIATEAKDVCSNDPIVTLLLDKTWTQLESALTALSQKTKNEGEGAKQWTRLGHILADTLDPLRILYLDKATAKLGESINNGDEEAVMQYAGLLPSDPLTRTIA